MYWILIVGVVVVAILVSGLIGALPGIILGLILAAIAAVYFALSGRDSDAPSVVQAPKEPTGQVRGTEGHEYATGTGSSAATANERTGQE